MADIEKLMGSESSLEVGQKINEIIENKLNADLSNLSETGEAKFNAKVSKSGDTMTGNLRLNSASLNITGGSIFTRNTTYALDDKASTAKYEVVIQHEDKNNVRKSRLESAWLTDGSHLTAMSEKKSASENSYASIQVGWDKNGTAYATAPTPPTGDNSTKIATTAFCKNMATTTKATTTSSASATRPAWIVQNYVSGASWYRVWSDGWIEQGGTSAVFTTNPIEIALLKNFANTNYSLQFTPYGTNVRGYCITVSVKNTNNFSAICGYATNTGISNTAIGDCKVNWYACGY